MTDRRPSNDFFVVGVGASAGGVAALSSLFSHIPKDTGMAFVVILHLIADKPSSLPEILDRTVELDVVAAEEGMVVEANKVYVIQPNDVLTVRDGILHRARRILPPGRHMPIDALFGSLAEDQSDKAVGVILTGGDGDGIEGLTAIRKAAGITLAQDPQSAEHPQMPQNAIDAGVVDKVLSIEQIAGEIAELGRRGGVGRVAKALQDDDEAYRAVGDILGVVEEAVGVSFEGYKRGTLTRRIARRMVLNGMAGPKEYLDHLRSNDEEVRRLYQDLLIMVTEFFREPETFAILKSDILPNVLQDKSENRPLRIWVVGCASGQEAYSLAIAVLEYFDQGPRPAVQVFATDVNGQDIERARAGFYSNQIREQVSPERLSRFFDRLPDGYRVKKSVREMCIFAQHDVTRDPPFTKIDLLSCRNVLIYFDRPLQDQLMSVFHYALRPSGYLVLGRSEAVAHGQDLFEVVDKKNNVYSRLPGSGGFALGGRPLMPRMMEPRRRAIEQAAMASSDPLDIEREANDTIASRYAPPGVVVDAEYRVIQFRGDTSRYLMNPPGDASFDVVSMAREGLSEALQATLEQAKKKQGPTVRRNVDVKPDGQWTSVNLEVLPFRAGPSLGDDATYFVVSFHEDGGGEEAATGTQWEDPKVEYQPDEAQLLRRELDATRRHLQSVIRDKQKSTDELQASYEEIQSSNEELQSTNEELETAKEELQSINEELTMVNEELQKRNDELVDANDDLANLLSGIDIPIIIVGEDLRIRRFTPGIERITNLITSDIGRPITDLTMKVTVPDLARDLQRAVDEAVSVDREVTDEEDAWFSLRVRPYKTGEGRIEGAVLTFVDIDDVKRNLELAQEASFSEARSAINGILSVTSDPVEVIQLAMAEAGKAVEADSAFYAKADGGAWAVELVHQITSRLIGSTLQDAELPALGALRAEKLPAQLHAKDIPPLHALTDRGVTHVLVIPIVEGDAVTGVVFFNRHDRRPQYTEGQVAFAGRFAATLSLSMDTLRLRQVERRMADELRNRMRPERPDLPGLQLGLASQFAERLEQVGGDFVDVFDIGGRSAVLIGDVAGKGLAATSFVEAIRGAVRALSHTESDPGRVLTMVNDTLFEFSGGTEMATAVLAFSDPDEAVLRMAIAGHTTPVLCQDDCELLEADHGPPLGALEDSSYATHRFPFPIGSTLVAYTDGVTEARVDHELFGEERLLELVRNWRAKEADELAHDLLARVMEYQQGPMLDDAIVLVVRRV